MENKREVSVLLGSEYHREYEDINDDEVVFKSKEKIYFIDICNKEIKSHSEEYIRYQKRMNAIGAGVFGLFLSALSLFTIFQGRILVGIGLLVISVTVSTVVYLAMSENNNPSKDKLTENTKRIRIDSHNPLIEAFPDNYSMKEIKTSIDTLLSDDKYGSDVRDMLFIVLDLHENLKHSNDSIIRARDTNLPVKSLRTIRNIGKAIYELHLQESLGDTESKSLPSKDNLVNTIDSLEDNASFHSAMAMRELRIGKK